MKSEGLIVPAWLVNAKERDVTTNASGGCMFNISEINYTMDEVNAMV